MPKPLAVFVSANALQQFPAHYQAVVLLTTCCGPGINASGHVLGERRHDHARIFLKKLWLQCAIWGADAIIESIAQLKALYKDCHGGNVVPVKWPVGHDEDFDFAVVDLSGLLPLCYGREGQNKARPNLEGLVGMYTRLQNQVYKEELARIYNKVYEGAIFFPRMTMRMVRPFCNL